MTISSDAGATVRCARSAPPRNFRGRHHQPDVLRPVMATSPAPVPGSAATAAAAARVVGWWRVALVAVPHIAALAIMFATEDDLWSRTLFLLTWAFLNFAFVTAARRPAISGAMSLTVIVLL